MINWIREKIYVFNRGENGNPVGKSIGVGKILADGSIHLELETIPNGKQIVITPQDMHEVAFDLISQDKFVNNHRETGYGESTGLTIEEFTISRKRYIEDLEK